MATRTHGWLVASVTLALLSVDQLSKLWIQTNLRPSSSIAIVPQVFWLSHFTNSGAVGGIGRQSPLTVPLLVLGSVVLIVVLIALYLHYARHLRPSWRISLFLALSITPLLSHGFDRVRQGYIVDFLHFAGLPVFNLADIFPYIAITLLGLELISYLRARQRVRDSGPAVPMPG